MTVSRRKWLVIILLAAFVARAAFSLRSQVTYPDSHTDLEVARNLLDGKGFVFGERSLLRAPGYPLLLASSLALGGWWFAILVQVLAGTATCYVVYALARERFGQAESLFAAAFSAVYPIFWYMAGTLLGETLFILFFAASIFYLLRLRARLKWTDGLALGALSGVACLIRPSHFLFLPFLLPFFVARGQKRLKALGLWALAMAASLVAMSPWIVRNYVHTGRLVFTTLQTGASLYEANSSDATGGPGMDTTNWPDEIHSMPEYERNQYLLRKAQQYMVSHPGRTWRLAIVKFRRFWSPVPNDPEQRTVLVSAAMLVSYVPAMLLGLVGLVSSIRRKQSAGLLLVPIIYYVLLHMVFVGSVRYRVPVMPLVLVFAGSGIRAALDALGHRLSKRACNGT